MIVAGYTICKMSFNSTTVYRKGPVNDVDLPGTIVLWGDRCHTISSDPRHSLEHGLLQPTGTSVEALQLAQ